MNSVQQYKNIPVTRTRENNVQIKEVVIGIPMKLDFAHRVFLWCQPHVVQ